MDGGRGGVKLTRVAVLKEVLVKMPCSDILRFAKLLFENKVRVNRINLSEGKQNLGFEFSEFELSGVNYY